MQLQLRGTGVTEVAKLTGLSCPAVRTAFSVDVIRRTNALNRNAITVPDAELDEVRGAGRACTGPSAASSRGCA